jgi:hypothetical protein
MRVSRFVVLVAVLTVAALVPASAVATEDNDDSGTYMLLMEAPNIGMSGDGDTISVEGHAVFSWHPKSFTGSGTFTLTNDGVTLSGTWSGGDMIRFTPYGCGVLAGTPIDANACGGIVTARVVLTSGTQQMTAILSVVCVIGDTPGQFFESRNATEGVAVNVIGVENYSHPVTGENVYIRTGGTED